MPTGTRVITNLSHLEYVLITVAGITKRYGRKTVVEDLTFDVRPGRVTGFVGPNGAGKSTTMRMMVGLTRPDRGQVRYQRIRYDALKEPARVVGSVLEARCTHPGRTARRHLQVLAALSNIPSTRVEEVLTEVGLAGAADLRAGGFSLGMQQRLALAGALLGEPQVLLLDEPSNGLDPDGIRWLRMYLGGYARMGGTVFVSSHLIGELAMFADDLIVVGGGKLLAANTVRGITAGTEVTVMVETTHPELLVGLLVDHQIDATFTGTKVLARATTRDAVARVAFDNHIFVREITENAPSLEDRLLTLTQPSAEYAAEYAVAAATSDRATDPRRGARS